MCLKINNFHYEKFLNTTHNAPVMQRKFLGTLLFYRLLYTCYEKKHRVTKPYLAFILKNEDTTVLVNEVNGTCSAY